MNNHSQKGASLLYLLLTGTVLFISSELALLAYFKMHPRQAAQTLPNSSQSSQDQKESTEETDQAEAPTETSPQPHFEEKVTRDNQENNNQKKSEVKLDQDFLSWLPDMEAHRKNTEKIQQDIQDRVAEDLAKQEPLLNVLPPKERAELEDAIRQAQEVVGNIQPYNPSDIFNPDDIAKNLEGINKQAQKRIAREMAKHQEEFTPPNINFDNFQPPVPYHRPPPVYLNPLNNPDINPMANPDINPLMNPDINPLANPEINPMANPEINPGCIPCQFAGQ